MAEPRELLRMVTAGSVDDGKSTLIGRLLYDSLAVPDDTLESLRRSRMGQDGFDLAFISDGLKDEREQGITIDVAYRYFRTPRRSFIIADCPGHVEFTRNMVTGASTASLGLLLVDARKGILEQTRRHAWVLGLMGIPQVVAAINKMDLVAYDAEVFHRIREAFLELAVECGIPNAGAIPVSALIGDNVTLASTRMPWYDGPFLLEYLQTVDVRPKPSNGSPLRLPVQCVIRQGEFRGYAGTIASGRVETGMSVLVLPGGSEARIRSIHAPGGDCEMAEAPAAITLCLEDHVECGRGSLIADAASPPSLETRLECDLVWVGHDALEIGRPYFLKHCSQTVCAQVERVLWRMDFESLQRGPAAQMRLNDIGRVALEVHKPLAIEPYADNRTTGSLILIDPRTNETAAAGMVRRPESATDSERAASTSRRHGLVIWFTGLSAAGKSTLSDAVYQRLWAMGQRVEHLDGDAVRRELSSGLGFSNQDRVEHIRRMAFVAEMLSRHGVIVLVSAISPYREMRDEARRRIGSEFIEVYVNAPLEVCIARDTTGLYRRARALEIRGVSGLDDPYEPPSAPELECRTDLETVPESVQRIMDYLGRRLT
jgi:bifunctional enzyme CysN/CysC